MITWLLIVIITSGGLGGVSNIQHEFASLKDCQFAGDNIVAKAKSLYVDANAVCIQSAKADK